MRPLPFQIPDWELDWSFVRSSGPGGQNVNKVNSKAVVHWNVYRSSLPADLKQRALTRLANRLTADGCVVVASDRYRDQPRNRDDCLEKLHELLEWATFVPKARKKTKPSFSSKKKKQESKKLDSRKKNLRGKVRDY